MLIICYSIKNGILVMYFMAIGLKKKMGMGHEDEIGLNPFLQSALYVFLVNINFMSEYTSNVDL